MKEQFQKHLELALRENNIDISDKQIEMLKGHFLLLEKWREIHNLTTISGIHNIVFHHYLDCLLGLSFLSPSTIVWDFGSGAGFPGLIAAIFWPSRQIVLVESARKKCSFLREVSRQIGLTNVEIKQCRVEQLEDVPFALSRATFSLQTLQLASKALLKNDGRIALWVTEAVDQVEQFKKFQLVIEAEFSYEWPGIKARKIILLKKT